MTTLQQAAQQALEALEWDADYDTSVTLQKSAITALRQALEAEQQDEPYLWYDEEKGQLWNRKDAQYMDMSGTTPLYRHQQPCQTCEALARTVMMDQRGLA